MTAPKCTRRAVAATTSGEAACEDHRTPRHRYGVRRGRAAPICDGPFTAPEPAVDDGSRYCVILRLDGEARVVSPFPNQQAAYAWVEQRRKDFADGDNAGISDDMEIEVTYVHTPEQDRWYRDRPQVPS